MATKKKMVRKEVRGALLEALRLDRRGRLHKRFQRNPNIGIYGNFNRERYDAPIGRGHRVVSHLEMSCGPWQFGIRGHEFHSLPADRCYVTRDGICAQRIRWSQA